MTAAGAGPSSTMASAVEMNAGPIWTLPACTERNWPATARTKSEASRSNGRQSFASVASTAAVDGRHEQHGFAGDQDRSPARS